MRLTDKLLSLIHRAIRKDPDRFIALRFWYSTGSMTWSVQDAVLTTSVSDGPGVSLSIDLTQYTVTSLVQYLAAQPGYSVIYVDGSDLANLSARVLVDGTGDIATSNGNILYGYTNVVYSFFESMAVELADAEAQVAQAIRQMSTKTANDIWLDEIGSYYGIPRLDGELDSSYGPRIIAEVLRPRGNNVAIESAIQVYTGQQATVTDVVEYGATSPVYDGSISHDGSHTHNSSAKPVYGLFDVQYGYDLINGGDITAFANTVRDLIDRLRDAGTHLRALTLSGSQISDTFNAPTDEGNSQNLSITSAMSDSATPADDSILSMSGVVSGLSDSLTPPNDTSALALSITYNVFYNGVRSYNGAVQYSGGTGISETL